MANEIFRKLSTRIQAIAAKVPALSADSDGKQLAFLMAIDRCMASAYPTEKPREMSILKTPSDALEPTAAFLASKFYFFAVAKYFAEWVASGANSFWLDPTTADAEKVNPMEPAFPAVLRDMADRDEPFFVSRNEKYSGAASAQIAKLLAENPFAGIEDIRAYLPRTWGYVDASFKSLSTDPVTGVSQFKPLMEYVFGNWDRLSDEFHGKAASETAKPEPVLAVREAPKAPSIPKVVGMSKQIAAFHVAMKARKPSMLVGPTGSGKTHLVKQYCAWDNGERAKAGQPALPLVVHTFHQESSPTEIIGTKTLENGSVKWVDSEFMKLFSNGGTYFADEFNFAPAGAHAPLFAALNGDEEIFVPESGKTYKRHPDFRFVAACNPASKYGGRQPVDKALASRFYVSVDFGYLAPAEERSLLLARVPGLTKDEATKVVSVANALRDAEAKGMIFVPFGTRDALHVAALITEGYSPDEAVEYGFSLKSDNDEQRSEIRKAAGSAKTMDIKCKEDYELERDAALATAKAANEEKDRAVADNKAMYKELKSLRERAQKFDELRKALAA